jgi:hypothetical protein
VRELFDIQADRQVRLDNLPERLQDSALAEHLREVRELDLPSKRQGIYCQRIMSDPHCQTVLPGPQTVFFGLPLSTGAFLVVDMPAAGRRSPSWSLPDAT